MDRAEGCARKDRAGVRDGPQGNAKALVNNKKSADPKPCTYTRHRSGLDWQSDPALEKPNERDQPPAGRHRGIRYGPSVFFGVGTATLSFGFKAAGFSTSAGVVATALAFGFILLVLAYALRPSQAAISTRPSPWVFLSPDA